MHRTTVITVAEFPAMRLTACREHYLRVGPALAHIVGATPWVLTFRGCDYCRANK